MDIVTRGIALKRISFLLFFLLSECVCVCASMHTCAVAGSQMQKLTANQSAEKMCPPYGTSMSPSRLGDHWRRVSRKIVKARGQAGLEGNCLLNPTRNCTG